MAKKRAKEFTLKKKYVLWSLAAGLLYYLAHYFNFPNSYGLAVSLTFLILLLKNFKTIKGNAIILYSMIVSAVIIPMTIGLVPYQLSLKLGLIAFNLLFIFVIGFGLFKLKKWAIVLAILVNLLSSYQLVYSVVPVLASVPFNIYVLLFMLRNATSLLFSFGVIVYLLIFWKKFK